MTQMTGNILAHKYIASVRYFAIPISWAARGSPWTILWIPVNGASDQIDLMCPTGTLNRKQVGEIMA